MLPKTKLTPKEKQILALLRQYDYRIAGDTIIKCAIRGWSSERVYGRCRSIHHAAENLIWLIGSEYHTKLRRILEA